ncbi:MAG: DUF5110 domain-containing protein [Clostridia bacterium]|nr:DUF5110 domain-containing protein [Clostridia bacterium]
MPIADPRAVVQGDTYRFTILTSRLIRIEYHPDGQFEDRATQLAICRNFEVPEFTVTEKNGILTITTEHVEITYTKERFSPNSLQVRYRGENSRVKAGNNSTVWGYGTETYDNLFGTARTLDTINGACPLEKGIMSMGTVTVLDDSCSLIIRDDGWVEPRKDAGIDQYLFCYGDAKKRFDYRACLKDFYRLTGHTPMLPRFALGNWWSRYHAYTQDEYMNLVRRFKQEEIPFSVAVIDMDWHYTQIDPKYGTGWTGYTWNRELFPDYKGFLAFLHQEGMEPSLNLHPQEGVAAHEESYSQMATAMGIDPATEETVPFEIENPVFMENYFKYLHNPMEEDGVRFWWMDWQQGNTTRIPGLDPLWMLNHFHYIDNCRNGQRGMMFSRYAGPGSHRYPIGFSGDTHITWESLDFQPYFTATASNIGYGWWSHDIGGHMAGYRDEELITRWFQLGVFSPVNRLHSSNSPFNGKEPWKYNKISELSMKEFLRLRHRMIPYLYTMNYRASTQGEPLVQPLYYGYTEHEAYQYKNEYLFGTEMLVSPITSPHDAVTTMGSVKTYLPEGEWYDFFSNIRYQGGKTMTMFRELDAMPVFVKSGGIIPLTKHSQGNRMANPEDMNIRVFAGADNVFELYEDDGNTENYKNGQFAITKMELIWGETTVFTVHAPIGDCSVVPEQRGYAIEIVGVQEPENVIVTEDGVDKEFSASYVNGVLTVYMFKVKGTLEIQLAGIQKADNDIDAKLCHIIEKLEQIPNDSKGVLYQIIQKDTPMQHKLMELMQLDVDKHAILAITELLTADC